MTEINIQPAFRHLSILILWGKHHLLNSDHSSLNELEIEWESADTSSIVSDIIILEQRIHDSLNMLHGPITVDTIISESDSVVTALNELDQLIFLSESIEFYPHEDSIPEILKLKTEDLLQLMTIDREVSYLRLIPLNQWRRQVLDQIPDQSRFLFPWYCEWVDLPETIFDTLSDHKADNLTETIRSILPIDFAKDMFLTDLNADRMLLEKIRKDVIHFTALSGAIEESYSIRLFIISNDESEKRKVHDPLRQKGIEAAALHFINTPAGPEHERIEQFFLTAFCGTFLDDKQRLDSLYHMEIMLKQLDEGLINSSVIIKKFYSWTKGNLTDNELTDQIFDLWEGKIKTTAKKTGVSDRFYHAVEKLRMIKPSPIKPENDRKSLRSTGVFTWVFRYLSPKFVAVTASACFAVSLAVNIYVLPLKTGKIQDETKPIIIGKPIPPKKSQTKGLKDSKPAPQAPPYEKNHKSIHNADKINLLIPLIKGKKPVKSVPFKKKKRARSLSPLENIELYRLNLVAIVLTPEGNKAMIEDFTGQGYIISKGTAIGPNNGRVSKILKDKVIIEEEKQGTDGKITMIKKEILFNKGSRKN